MNPRSLDGSGRTGSSKLAEAEPQLHRASRGLPAPILSVVVPCYNEADNLTHVFEALVPALEDAVGDRWELVIVDDGSADATFALVAQAHLREPRIKGIRLSRNFGHQAAVTTGLAFASGANVGIIDADLQDPVGVLIQLYEKVADGKCDVCIGVRGRRDASLWLRIAYRLFYDVIGRLSDPPWPRNAGDFCVFNRRVHTVLLALPERTRTLRGLRSWVGFRQAQIEYDRPARRFGSSKYNFVKLLSLALDSFVSFSNVPLRLASLAGIGMSFATLAIAALFLVNRLFPEVTVFGFWVGANPGVTTIVLYLSFVASILFFCLGIIGEYVLLLLRESQRRPSAIVDTLLGVDNRTHAAAPVATTLVAPAEAEAVES
jgi:dolichol-phosphate mannosyltransferase